MRVARIEVDGAQVHGIVEGKTIHLTEGGLFDDGARTGKTLALADAKFLIPLEPKTFYAAGLNYAEHVIEVAKANGREPNIPTEAHIGYRANNALIAHNAAIVKPRDAGEEFQYEAELVVVIGKQAKNLTEAEALDCVFGYTIGNDVSERHWQRADRTLWRAKNTDTFAPMGPWIETEVDLESLVTTVRLNEREVITFPTNSMIFGVAHYLSEMSKYFTLYPGDMVWMGTEGRAENMKPGDVCEIDISSIGTLRNLIIAEA
jgi:2-keto-4-pentenoate hydratase/2-oxohepta-3-ene-1,7-dioic acid hydratase in catechol pathway